MQAIAPVSPVPLSELPLVAALINAARSASSPSPPRKVINAVAPQVPKVPGKEITACVACKITRAEYKRKYEEWKASQGYTAVEFNYLHAWKRHNNNKKPNSKCVYPWEDHDEYVEKEKKDKKSASEPKSKPKTKKRKERKCPDVCPGTCGATREAFIAAYVKFWIGAGSSITELRAGVSWAAHTRAAAKGEPCPPTTFGAKPQAAQVPPVAQAPQAAQVPQVPQVPAPAKEKEKKKKAKEGKAEKEDKAEDEAPASLTDVTKAFLESMGAHCQLLEDNLETNQAELKELDMEIKICEGAISDLEKKKHKLEGIRDESRAKRQKVQETLEKVRVNLSDFKANVATLSQLSV